MVNAWEKCLFSLRTILYLYYMGVRWSLYQKSKYHVVISATSCKKVTLGVFQFWPLRCTYSASQWNEVFSSVWGFFWACIFHRWAAKVQVSLHICADSPEPLLFTYELSTLFAYHGSFIDSGHHTQKKQNKQTIISMQKG